MACANHGLQADCGPECSGFLHPSDERERAPSSESVGPDEDEIDGELTEAEAAAVAAANEGPTEH